MNAKKSLSVPRPPTKDEIVKKKQLATSILEHLIEEGLVPELSSSKKAPYAETTIPEQETEPDH
ncbi:hypothetical protein NIES22_50800 [Calothrix brevissima NIES-22]|nr:hypothetical protein NIES22_50800 [Calothrix brevissima NIES-22]